MKTFTFSVSYGCGPKLSHGADFDLELDDQEIEYIKSFLKANGDCGYEYVEEDNRALFEKINDAANDAVLRSINSGRKNKLDFWDVDWGGMFFGFCWPEELRSDYVNKK